jgi:bifunctional DNA-binding transcriptional regulator/antitoxin component of YhaV-PrlF toxin-antitoxin module
MVVLIPREVLIRYGIQPGAVFVIQEQNDKKEHYFVVLNQNPKTDHSVILVSATTKHYKEKQYIETWHFSEDTLVVIEDGQSQIITKKSTFNCNRYRPRSLDKLCTGVDYKLIEYTGKVIEEDILRHLRAATLCSPRLVKKYRPCLEAKS